jgi:hypothetical protein
MPNHVSNCLDITGPSDQIREFAHKFEKDGYNVIKPVPEEIRDICCGSVTINNVQYTHWRKNPNIDYSSDNISYENKIIPLSEDEWENLVMKYGQANSLDWGIVNWGTKWNAYQLRVLYSEPWIENEIEYISAFIYFNSAWSPPIPVVEELPKLHPEWIIALAYCEQGSNYIGKDFFTVENGRLIESYDLSSFSLDESLIDQKLKEMIENDILIPEDEDELYDFTYDNGIIREVHGLPLTERYTGFAKELFEKYPFMHEGG